MIATSLYYTPTTADAGMALHFNLMGTSGSEQIVIVRGCDTSGSNCNACTSDSDLEVWVIIVICVAAALAIIAAIGLAVWCYKKKSGSTDESGVDNEAQTQSPNPVQPVDDQRVVVGCPVDNVAMDNQQLVVEPSLVTKQDPM